MVRWTDYPAWREARGQLRIVHGNTYDRDRRSAGLLALAARIKVSRALSGLRVDVHNREQENSNEPRPTRSAARWERDRATSQPGETLLC
jgi:hypothetical protein